MFNKYGERTQPCQTPFLTHRLDNYWVDYCYTLDPENFYDGKQVNSQQVLMA